MLHIDLKYTHLLSPRLQRFHRKSDYLFCFRCPLCGDSKKDERKTRGYLYRKENEIKFKCHNCLQTLPLGLLIKQLDSTLYREYCLERFRPGYSNTAPSLTVPIPQVRFGQVTERFLHAERCDTLPDSHLCVNYLHHRQIPKSVWSRLYYTEHYKQLLDEAFPGHGKHVQDDARLVIPYRDVQGSIQALSGRAIYASPNALRYVTIRDASLGDTTKLVFGLECVDQTQRVYVTEGPLDSLFITNTVASGDANLIGAAQRLSSSQIVLIYDNEPRNTEIVAQMERALKDGYQIVIWPDTVKGKDINEMVQSGRTPAEIKTLIDTSIVSGITGLTKLVFWKRTQRKERISAWVR